MADPQQFVVLVEPIEPPSLMHKWGPFQTRDQAEQVAEHLAASGQFRSAEIKEAD